MPRLYCARFQSRNGRPVVEAADIISFVLDMVVILVVIVCYYCRSSSCRYDLYRRSSVSPGPTSRVPLNSPISHPNLTRRFNLRYTITYIIITYIIITLDPKRQHCEHGRADIVRLGDDRVTSRLSFVVRLTNTTRGEGRKMLTDIVHRYMSFTSQELSCRRAEETRECQIVKHASLGYRARHDSSA